MPQGPVWSRSLTLPALTVRGEQGRGGQSKQWREVPCPGAGAGAASNKRFMPFQDRYGGWAPAMSFLNPSNSSQTRASFLRTQNSLHRHEREELKFNIRLPDHVVYR